MTIENKIRFLAGTMIIVSLGLSQWHHSAWLLMTAFVGLNLLQSSVTKFCPAEILLKSLQKNQ